MVQLMSSGTLCNPQSSSSSLSMPFSSFKSPMARVIAKFRRVTLGSFGKCL